ncbi:MAG: peptidase S10 [Candidatus Eisenbacteria bacterium]|uniref:Peptidase S10 n=1 Tax=Eiseniibacteriota bacterium TaxID=2212470 RepID=A0A7Y2E815_UNCEI|nr:peptidase S10 [Candidatus Eisenbacteria bacterium]
MSPEETESVTKHTITIGGQSVTYTATAGTINLTKEDGTARASVFYMAYTRDNAGPVESRPLTFSFNGGPGSSSVWLHLGVFGPRIVVMDEDGNAPTPPYSLRDNPHSLIDVSDFVFIDPVSTGYSRAVEGNAEPKEFHGLDKDIEAVAEFIRKYVTRNERWSSPKFLVGESYGTTRAAGLSNYLQNRHGMYFNGIMLVSSILEFQTARFHVGNDLPYMLFLPTYTATAWYHNQLPSDLQGDLQTALRASEDFALGEYAEALLKGTKLDEAQRNRVAKELARLTGLSEEYVQQSDLKVPIWMFCKELMRDERRTAGRLDSRFIGIDRDGAGDSYEYDASYAEILGPYTATMNDYVRRELKYETDLPYEILTGKVRPWDYTTHQNQYVNVAERLREAMTKNPDLKVFVANGYYDLATPYFATEYTFSRLGLDPTLRDNVTMAYYESGHMMYIHQPSLVKMKADLKAFVESALPR